MCVVLPANRVRYRWARWGGQQGDIARQQLSPWEAWRHYSIIVKGAHRWGGVPGNASYPSCSSAAPFAPTYS